MKSAMRTIWIVMALVVSACAAPVAPTATPTAAPTATPTAVPTPAVVTLKTAVGDLEVVSARRVDEANGVQAAAGEKILLVILTQPGQAKLAPGMISLEAFQTAVQDVSNGQVHVSTETGPEAICSMAGWVADEFAMGFRVPAAAQSYTLYWPGNAPLTVTPKD